MAPTAMNSLSPAELAYLYSSLASTPPIRPDARSPKQFRPLVAETNILPGTNGSARICFADGTEALAGIKAEMEKAKGLPGTAVSTGNPSHATDTQTSTQQASQWVELSLEIPGHRDDDPLPVFLSAMLHESIVAGSELASKLSINPSWHWKLYIDILLLSPPLSYPVPLLSLTTHLALLSCRLPALKSAPDEDPFFDDDWDASTFIYPNSEPNRPAITLLVASMGQNILFDPSKEEIAVADCLLAVSLSRQSAPDSKKSPSSSSSLRLLSVRNIDPPAKLTTAGLADAENPSITRVQNTTKPTTEPVSNNSVSGVWKPMRGGISRTVLSAVIEACLGADGVGEEVLTALQAVEIS